MVRPARGYDRDHALGRGSGGWNPETDGAPALTITCPRFGDMMPIACETIIDESEHMAAGEAVTVVGPETE